MLNRFTIRMQKNPQSSTHQANRSVPLPRCPLQVRSVPAVQGLQAAPLGPESPGAPLAPVHPGPRWPQVAPQPRCPLWDLRTQVAHSRPPILSGLRCPSGPGSPGDLESPGPPMAPAGPAGQHCPLVQPAPVYRMTRWGPWRLVDRVLRPDPLDLADRRVRRNRANLEKRTSEKKLTL